MKIRIRELRTAAGLTLEELAAKAGISRSHLTNIELGKKQINATRLDQLARALKTNPSELIAGDGLRVPVIGVIGANGVVTAEHSAAVRCPLASVAPPACVTVGDEAFCALAPLHSTVFLGYEQAEPTEDGAAYLIRLDGGDIVAQVRRASHPGRYNLHPLQFGGGARWDVRLLGVRPVLFALPSALVDPIGG